MRAVTALEKYAQEEHFAREQQYQEDDFDQLYEAMYPGPKYILEGTCVDVVHSMKPYLGHVQIYGYTQCSCFQHQDGF